MNNSRLLALRVQEVLLDGKWIAQTNYKEQLLQVSYAETTHQVGSLNTIAHLTFHINYYLQGLLPVFSGGALEIRDKYSFDLPPLTSEGEWQQLVQTFLSNAEKFVTQVTLLSDEQLQGVFVKADYGTWQRNVEAMIEHSYYHLGQIVVLRKMISAANT